MGVLLRSLKLCLTSEGQQAVLAAVICLLVLQDFLDRAPALQAVTREAVSGLRKKNRSSSSQLAAWAVTHLVHSSQSDCNTIALSGGVEVVVGQLGVSTLVALQGLELMVELHGGQVWDALLALSGLREVIEYTQNMDLHEEEGLLVLGSIIASMHKLLEHPHNQAAVLQELKNSGVLELFFICAKSEVQQVSQPAVSCLVLIWQWYLRRSPAASFSMNQMSRFFPQEAATTAEGSAATAVGFTHHGAATAVESGGSQRPDEAQLWSVTPAVDFAANRPAPSSSVGRAPARGPALHLDTMHLDSFRSGIEARSDPGVGPVGVPLPPRATSKVSSGSLSPFGHSPKAAAAAYKASSSSSSRHSHGCIPWSPTAVQAPSAGVNPLLACVRPRVTSSMSAERTALSPIPVGGGQSVSRPDNRAFAASSWAPGSSTPEQMMTPLGHIAIPGGRPLVTSISNQGAAGWQSPKQLQKPTSAAASVPQRQARHHSMSNADSHHDSSLLCSPAPSRNTNNASEAPITPPHVAGLPTHVRRVVENSTHSSSTPPAAAGSGAPRAEQAAALSHDLPQGTSSQGTCSPPNQGGLLPAVQAVKQQRQAEPLQHIHTWQGTNPEEHWQPLPLAHPLPSVECQAEGHERQSLSGLERQNLDSAPSPQHGRPTQRVLLYSPVPTMESGDQGQHPKSPSMVPYLQDGNVVKAMHSRGSVSLPEDSAWGSCRPHLASSASVGSSVIIPQLGSKDSCCDEPTHSGHYSTASGQNVESVHTEDANARCPSHVVQSGNCKESKMSQILHWLTNPDSRDVRLAQKMGIPVEMGG
ncbi:hypothetical protein ABBQ32_010628 [Trebouxia sp. C0010 RCD-2024]